MTLDFSRCRNVWVPDSSDLGGFWSPPFPHVKTGVQWIIDHPYALLADDMGGAKSAQTIIAAQFLSELNIIDRVIVVAPASVRPVWSDKDFGQLREHLWLGKKNKISEYHARVRQWVHEPECSGELKWIITNYEYIRNEDNLATLLPYCGPKTLLVLDESSAVKGHKSNQTDACMILRWQTKKGRPILGAPRCGRILELNGTPVAESPRDLFSQANLLHPDILECRYITHFQARYELRQPVKSHGRTIMRNNRVVQETVGFQNLDDLQRRMAPYVLRREAKDLGIDFALPPVGLTVMLTDKTWRVYREMRDEMVVWLKSSVATASTAAVKSMRLAQITSGFVGGIEDVGVDQVVPDWLDDVLDRPRIDAPRGAPSVEVGREKLDFTLAWHADLLKRYPDLKLLTWCRFVPELRRYLYEERLTFPSIPVGAVCGQKVFEGEHGHRAERDYALRLLHPKTAPSGPATVGATQGTGAMGLNFTACRTVLDMSYDFSPWKKKQGDARVNRPGQTGPVSFFYLIAVGPKNQRTIDHHIMMQRLGKTNINDWTMSQWVTALTEE